VLLALAALAVLAVLALSSTGTATAQQPRPNPEAPAQPPRGSQQPRAGQQSPTTPPAGPTTTGPTTTGETLAVPTLSGDGGPLFDLQAVAERLGGRLVQQRGGGWTLTLGETQALFGADNASVAVGTELVPLSQAPRVLEGRVYVPVDFLAATYGRVEGIAVRWDEGERRLRIDRRGGRTLAVTTDVVHLSGVTTVVLQFPERPAYRVEQEPGRVIVQLGQDRLAEPGRRPVDDPLVTGLELERSRIVLQLAPGTVADSYTLSNPFRLVFDVVQGEAAATGLEPAPEAFERPAPPSGIRTIVLDPGHGGSESGAVGPSGVVEKELTLAIARELQGRLAAELGVRVILTRGEDAYLPLETRSAIANQNKADLFVSLHLNSAFGPGAHGAETYFLSAQASDERAARAAAAENRPGATGPGAGGAGGAAQGDDPLYDLQLILWDLAQTHYLSQSQQLAKLIQGELNQALGLRDRGVKQAPFVVLMGAAMPAVLVELGFVSNPDEERKLQDPAYRSQLADALVRAIGAYKSQVEGTAAEEEAAAAGTGTATPGTGNPGTGGPAAATPGAAREERE
jgi:N-acetylmuramoyl-L-alanine amidase